MVLNPKTTINPSFTFPGRGRGLREKKCKRQREREGREGREGPSSSLPIPLLFLSRL